MTEQPTLIVLITEVPAKIMRFRTGNTINKSRRKEM